MSQHKAALAVDFDPPIVYPASDGEPVAETDIHRDLMFELIGALKAYFQAAPDVYISGNLFIYYVEGKPARRVAPDLFVVRGVGKHERRVYKLWEEGVVPEVVIELSSRQTWKEDLERKRRLYAQLGVKEYFIFDPEYGYLIETLVGYSLRNGRYVHLKVKDRRVMSAVLGLELVDTGQTLRLFNPQTNSFLPTRAEQEQAQRQAEKAQRQAEEARRQEAAARQQAEASRRQEADARQQAEQARQQAEAEVQQLQERLRQLGLEP